MLFEKKGFRRINSEHQGTEQFWPEQVHLC